MLLQLPNELLSLVLRSAEDDDIASLMLINRHIHQLMLPRFSDMHFSTLKMTFLKPNLNRLEKIISCDAYRQAVCRLHFQLLPGDREEVAWRRHPWDRSRRTGNLDRVYKILAASFPNCNKILVDFYDPKSNLTHGGWWYVLTLPEMLSCAFYAVAHLTQSLVSFKLVDYGHGTSDYDDDPLIPASLSHTFWAAWSRLQTLNIDQRCNLSEISAAGWSNLISNAHGLRKLALQYCLDKPSPLYNLLVTANNAPKITHLHINHAYFFSSQNLIKLLKVFEDSLEHLFISHATIESGTWQDVCFRLRHGFPKLTSLALTCCRLAESPNVRIYDTKLQLFYPLKNSFSSSELRGFQFHEIFNRKLGKSYCVVAIRYSGSNIQWALEVIEDAIYTEQLPGVYALPIYEWDDYNYGFHEMFQYREVSRFDDPEFVF